MCTVVVIVVYCLKDEVIDGIETQSCIIIFGRYPEMTLLDIGKHLCGIAVTRIP